MFLPSSPLLHAGYIFPLKVTLKTFLGVTACLIILTLWGKLTMWWLFYEFLYHVVLLIDTSVSVKDAAPIFRVMESHIGRY